MNKKTFSVSTVLIAVALYLTAFSNFAFFRNLQAISQGSDHALAHAVSFALLLLCSILILLALLCWGRALKPVLIFLIVLSSVTAYFMDTFNVVIGPDMLVNALATDTAETADLLTPRLFVYLLVLGILPSVLILKLSIERQGIKAALFSRLKSSSIALVTIAMLLASSSAFYTSVIREHKSLRYYTNPLTTVYSAYKVGRAELAPKQHEMHMIGQGAHIPPGDITRELIVMVVGETSRADRYSLNGYERPTNPGLAKRNVVSFDRVSACGTSTAISVPCMFALRDHEAFDAAESGDKGNLLDVLAFAGVHMLWRDNNSGSKGVSDRIQTEDFRSPEVNTICDTECRDEGMLVGLREYVDLQGSGDILIVLHQMGSHGPAYFKRYPDEFRVFVPTCETSQLDECTQQEISNSYDNSILYTDHFLSEVIDFLESYDDEFETGMIYVSDHGESLGEYGMYLHGLPYAIAPDAQTRVPVIMWFGRNYYSMNNQSMRSVRSEELSHDNVFHTLLGMFEIITPEYDPQKDILQMARNHSSQSLGLHPTQ